MFSLLFLWANVGVANAATSDWFWGRGQHVLQSKIQIFENDPLARDCDGSWTTQRIDGREGSHDVCLQTGTVGTVRFGKYRDARNWPISVVSLPHQDSFMHIVGCGIRERCMYSRENDVLVARTTRPEFNFQVRIYRHFSHQLQSIGNVDEYSLGDLSMSPVVTFPDGEPMIIGGIGMSKNGRWLALEQYRAGVMLLDLNSGALKMLTSLNITGGNYESDVLISVANDGKRVAYAGRGAYPSVIEDTGSCAKKVTTQYDDPADCPIANLQLDSWIAPVLYTLTPHLSLDAGEITNTYVSHTEMWQISIKAADYRGSRVSYLALGDSFTSGEGDHEDKFYLYDSNKGFDLCHLSSRSYPFLVEVPLVTLNEVHSVACSGARSIDVFGYSDYFGQGGRLSAAKAAYDDTFLEKRRVKALADFIPGILYQSDFLKHYQPTMVSVGIGGNDVGMTDKLRACLMPSRCDWAHGDGRLKARREILSLKNTLMDLYKNLKTMAPTAHFVTIGYPLVINQDGDCGIVLNKLIDDIEKEFMHEAIVYLNQVIQEASRLSEIPYISIEDSLLGHRLCEGDRAAMNDFRLGDDIGLGDIKVLGNESFHPTPFGHRLAADTISKQLVSNRVTPETQESPFWRDDGRALPLTRYEQLTTTRLLEAGNAYDVSLPGETFVGVSTVTITMRSEERVVASTKSTQNGGLKSTIVVPKDLGYGYHTLYVRGLQPDGQIVEFYQGFLLEPPLAGALAGAMNNLPKPNDSPPGLGDLDVLGVSNPAANSVNDVALHAVKQNAEPNYWWGLLIAGGIIVLLAAKILRDNFD